MHDHHFSIAPRPLSPAVLTRCAQASHLLLALDYDGTLVPIAPRPQDAKASESVLALLEELSQLPAVTTAILSGRSLHDLRALLPVPGLIYVGTHGAEFLTRQGEMRFLLPPEALLSVINHVQSDLLPLIGRTPGLTLERKQYAVALHYRMATPACSELGIQQFETIVKGYQQQGVPMEVIHGKHVIEARPAGINKGRALRAVLAEANPAPLPVCIGDDVTDEDAFREVNPQGISILVAEQPHATAAQYYLRDPDTVLAFLSQLVLRRWDRH